MLKKLAIVVGLLFVFAFISIWLQSRSMSRDLAADRAALKVGMSLQEALSGARSWYLASVKPAGDESAKSLLFINHRDSVSCDDCDPKTMKWDDFLAELGRRSEQLADTKWLFTYKASSSPARLLFSVTFEVGKLKEIGEKQFMD